MRTQGTSGRRHPRGARYKIWVHIEKQIGDDEGYEDIGLPDPIGVFATLDEAQAFVRTLPGWFAEGSDNRV